MTKQSKPILFLRDNSLSIAMFGLFVLFLVALSIAVFYSNNEKLAEHGAEAQTYLQYIGSGTFIEAVFENWESEFLQMAALVIGTIFLRQKGAADSKKISGWEKVDIGAHPLVVRGGWKKHFHAFGRILYAHSLSIALILLFMVSFMLHAVGGTTQHNEEALIHGQAPLSMWSYIGTSQFWFESFQNWQSEFLAVGTLLVLSIFFRQQGSSESKPLSDPNEATGK